MTFRITTAEMQNNNNNKTKGNAINQFYFERMVDSGAPCWIIALPTYAADIGNG